VKRGLAALLAVLTLAPPIVPRVHAQSTEADVYVGQAIVDFDDKRYDAALANLRRALQIEPDHVEALYYTGVVHMAQRRPAQAVPFLERARAKSPTDPSIAFQLGLAYFAQEQYDRAEPLLEQVFRAQPALDGLGYYVGFIRYRRKDYRGALRAFRAGRASDPEIQQLTRVYSGLALAAVGLPGQAAAEVEQALRLAPGSPVTGPAERLRDAVVAAREKERRFSAEVRVGVFFDDNVRVLPNPVDHADPNADPTVSAIRSQSRRSRDSIGELLGVRAEYVWWRTPDWESAVGYSFFLSYFNDVPSFNILDHLVTGSLVHKNAIGTMPIQVGMQYAFDALFLGGPVFVQRHTATLFGAIAESDQHLTQVLSRYQNKDFNEREGTPVREIRDADNWMAGIQHFLRFSEDRHYLKLGYQFDYENAEGRNYSYRGHRILTGAQYTLPWWSVRLKYDLDLHLRRYAYANSILPGNDPGRRRRHDEEVTHTIRVEVPLRYRLTLVGEFLKTDNRSNLEVFDYNRNVTSLSLVWSY
jgi:tetratricopeptide (TPR) repeat protein